MSFPVLQRMERKRPELIQPIDWKAEALKGLASGIESGIRIANTIQQIKTQRLENGRKEQESIVNIELAKETTRKLQLDNQEKERNAAISKAYLDGVQVDQLNEIGLRTQADAAAYITGVSTIMKVSGVPTSSQAVGPIDTPAPKTFIEGLSSGYLPKLQAQAKETANLMMDRGVSVADRFAAWDDVRGKAIPFSSAIDAYVAVGDPNSPVTAMSASFKPFVSKNTVTDAVNTMPMTIVVTEKNSDYLLSEIPKDEDGNPLDVAGLIASKYPVEVPLSKVIGGLGKGYFIDDVADEIKSADNPEPFIKYLEKRLAKKPEIMQELRVKAGLDVAVSGGDKKPETRTTIPEIPERPTTQRVTTSSGDVVDVPIYENITEEVLSSIGRRVLDSFDPSVNNLVEDIHEQLPHKEYTKSVLGVKVKRSLTPEQKAENYVELKKSYEKYAKFANDNIERLKADPENDKLRKQAEILVQTTNKLKDELSMFETKGAKNVTPKTETAAKLKAIVDTSGKDDSMVTVRYKGRTLKIKRDDLDEALKAGAVLQK